jgi:hypothetical protein
MISLLLKGQNVAYQSPFLMSDGHLHALVGKGLHGSLASRVVQGRMKRLGLIHILVHLLTLACEVDFSYGALSLPFTLAKFVNKNKDSWKRGLTVQWVHRLCSKFLLERVFRTGCYGGTVSQTPRIVEMLVRHMWETCREKNRLQITTENSVVCPELLPNQATFTEFGLVLGLEIRYLISIQSE